MVSTPAVRIEPTPHQNEARAAFRRFADHEILPYADGWDFQERIDAAVIAKVAAAGFLGAIVPQQYGGLEMDMVTWGHLNEEFGRGCSSLRSLLTVHSMVAASIQRWGTPLQKERWLASLASGRVVAAFALSEPNVGSDARHVETTVTQNGGSFILNGRKKWSTFGQIADLFLVFAQNEGKAAAFLVESTTPGVKIKPITGMLGTRASMLAELQFVDCHVPKENLVGKIGLGFSHVASAALDYGRYSVACGCVGIAQACLEASLQFTTERRQFGVALREHQLIQQMIADMVTHIKAARLLCQHAGYLKDSKDPSAIMETSVAKYFASTTASKAATDAVQIHGALGCSGESPVQRYWRDARIMEIIEGSTQIQQINIANYGYQDRPLT
jgi:glutaryl-CoA dehydrogenase (non-decarboxylating)